MLTINFKDFPVNHGDLVLDLGCGEGRHVINAYLQANIVALGVDLSLRDLATAQLRFAPFALVNEAGTAIKATENATDNNAKDNFVKQFYLQQADATCLPFGDASIDKIICSEVLEHIDNYRDVLREINRVLKPNGRLAISVPRAWPEKICWWLSAAYHENEGGHIRIFNANKLRVDIEGSRAPCALLVAEMFVVEITR